MKINWHGNDGRSFPKPGTTEKIQCGICGAQMKVRRNVLGPTNFVEALAGRKHRHDSFTCPNIDRRWHQRICQLKIDVYVAEITGAVDYKRKKQLAKREVTKFLKTHAAR